MTAEGSAIRRAPDATEDSTGKALPATTDEIEGRA
jgi:hypothetical protein